METSNPEALLKHLAEITALGCEMIAVVIIAAAALEATGRIIWQARRLGDAGLKKQIWMHFASAIILALEFTLAADIARTAISPSWSEIGQLAAIAAIRTVLNIYLERDLKHFSYPLERSSDAG